MNIQPAIKMILVLMLFSLKITAQVAPAHFTSLNLYLDSGKNNNNSDGSEVQSNFTNLYSRLRWATSISSGWMAGISAGYNMNLQNESDEQLNTVIRTKSISRTITFGPFVRKYFSIAENWSFFSEALISGGLGNSLIEQNSVTLSKLSEKELAATISGGLNYSLNNRWRIELQALSMQYRYSHSPQNEYNSIERTERKFSMSTVMDGINLGVIYVY